MAKKYFLFFFLMYFIAVPPTYTHAADLGLSAGALFPFSNFEDFADPGFVVGYHVKMNVYEAFNYGLAVNYGNAKGDNGVDFQEIDIYPFIDWIFYRGKNIYFFTRGGIGLFHWESDNIWWLDSEGNGIISTFGAGCRINKKFEVLANITKLYADLNIDCFIIRMGYNFDIGD